MSKMYVDDLLGILRELGLDLKTGCVIFIGGGALLLREYLEKAGKGGKCIFVDDICANAKGYELLYRIQKRQVIAIGKKNLYFTTIGFKRDDPDHVYVAEFLNSMSLGKAQYIVKAVMLYQDMQESSEAVSAGGAYDYERIRRVVLQVIEERERQMGIPVWDAVTKGEKKEPEQDVLTSLDEDALSGIMTSLVAFQQ